MNINYEKVLFEIVVLSGVIILIDYIFFASKRKGKKLPIIVDYARSFFPILLLVFLLRSFLFEAFRIPSGSLKPTLLVGDLILVNKYTYGIRLPLLHKKIKALNEPKRGDILVFRWPPDANINFIKRVIGVPGDHISYKNKILYVNGAEMPQTFVQEATDSSKEFSWKVVQKREKFFTVTHDIYQIPERPSDDFETQVPNGMYFVMGDNRDDSGDSRFWGYVPEEYIAGKAERILLSWDWNANWSHFIRWQRSGKAIQ